jgi:hypothetical protein
LQFDIAQPFCTVMRVQTNSSIIDTLLKEKGHIVQFLETKVEFVTISTTCNKICTKFMLK